MKKYIITAFHNKGYDLELDTIYVTENGLHEFRKTFESLYPSNYINKTDTGYKLESDIVIVIKQYEEPVFKDTFKVTEINVMDEGYESTYLHIYD